MKVCKRRLIDPIFLLKMFNTRFKSKNKVILYKYLVCLEYSNTWKKLVGNLILISTGIITSCLFRSCTFDESLKQAETLIFNRRNADAAPQDDILVPNVRGKWGPEGDLNEEKLVLAVTGMSRLPGGPQKDRQCLGRFIDSIDPDKINIPESLVSPTTLPAGAPVIDFLRAYSKKSDSWKFPGQTRLEDWSRLRNVSRQDGYDIQEMYVGATEDEEVRNFVKWANKCMADDQKDYPTSVVSAKAYMITISARDLMRIGVRKEDFELATELGTVHELDTDDILELEDTWKVLPAKIVFGNGLSWLVSVACAP